MASSMNPLTIAARHRIIRKDVPAPLKIPKPASSFLLEKMTLN